MTVAIAFALSNLPFVDDKPEKLIGYSRKFVDQWCAMNKINFIWIDESKTLRKTNGNVYYSWHELIEFYPDHKIIFLDPNGKTFLDEFEHPKEDVIYCIGNDHVCGFGDLDLSDKETVKLRVNKAWYALTVVPIVAYDRFVRLSL